MSTSINTFRALMFNNTFTQNVNKTNKSMEKLSTGLRINKAGDDAAGLAISEKMRNQIRGLEQGSRNTQDGISMVQVAEGGLEEVQNIIHRVNELAIQSANDTYTSEDRGKIQAEVEQLLSEVEDLASDTNFNGIDVLKFGGSETVNSMPSWIKIPDQFNSPEPLTPTRPGDPPGNYASVTIDFSKFDDSQANIDSLLGSSFYFGSCDAVPDHYDVIHFSDKTETTGSAPANVYIDITSATTSADLVQTIVDQVSLTINHRNGIMVDPTDPEKLIIYQTPADYPPKPNINGHGLIGYTDSNVIDKPDFLNIQHGPNNDENLQLKLPYIFPDSVGVGNIDVATRENAVNSIDIVKNTLDFISEERTRMGAYSNRMDFTYNRNDTTNENLTQAESRIRDVDVAKEMVKLSKHGMIEQLSSVMMKMHKTNAESILSILQ